MEANPSPTTAMRIARLEDQVAALTALVRPAPEPAPEAAPRSRPPRIAAVIAACAEVWGVPVATLYSARRHRRYAWPRQAAMYLAREHGHHSLLMLGRAFGRDHSTVFHGVRAAAARCAADPDYAALADQAAALSLTIEKEIPR